jgi:hypothetical protein
MEGEDLARKERKRRMELIQRKGMQRGSYPQFNVAVKGQKVVPNFVFIKWIYLPTCVNVYCLHTFLVNHLH